MRDIFCGAMALLVMLAYLSFKNITNDVKSVKPRVCCLSCCDSPKCYCGDDCHCCNQQMK